MQVIIDIEANRLRRPDKIWCIVCKDIDTGQIYIFRRLLDDPEQLKAFLAFTNSVTRFIGHNVLAYDLPVIDSLCGTSLSKFTVSVEEFASSGRHSESNPSSLHPVDTFLIGRMVDGGRPKHSVESYGQELGELYHKIKFSDFSKWSQELEDYCIRDVEITHKIYDKYKKYINNPLYGVSIYTEHMFQVNVCNVLHTNGFAFNTKLAQKYLTQVTDLLSKLDKDILDAFPPKTVVVRSFTPTLTKFGTISKTSVPRILHDKIHDYVAGDTYDLSKQVVFNPSSHKQLIDVLSESGWSPVNKTQTHIDTERELNKLKYSRNRDQTTFDNAIKDCYSKLSKLEKYGWKIDETNLSTLPPSAPEPAKLLAHRILLESRRRTLTEWLGLVTDEGRIHGEFFGIGAWTHRMAHQKPNTANIPNELDTAGNKKLLGKEMRSLWIAPRRRLLVGVDAEGIQLRIFAHYIDDPEFTRSLVEGRKDDKTDAHSLNQRVLGSVCKSRAAAKRFIYALLLGAGIGKLGQILACSEAEARTALDNLIQRYAGFQHLKETIIPEDARRGYFIGLDGRATRIFGDNLGTRKHLAMSGYLQNGEAVCMKLACLKWVDKLKVYDAKLVNFVHDELQTEVPNDTILALEIAHMQADSLRIVGEELKLKCPLAGSYWNDDLKDYTIATNWAYTH